MIDRVYDSNILIDALNGVSQARSELSAMGNAGISRITWIEIMAGTPQGSEAATERFLDKFSIIELTESIARLAAGIRAESKRLKLPDAIIWASAQVGGHELVTRNTRDFPAGTPGVRLPYTL